MSTQAFTTWQYNVAAMIYKVQDKIKVLHKVQEEIPLYKSAFSRDYMSVCCSTIL